MKWFARTAALAALLLSSCQFPQSERPAAPTAADPARPALWKVADADTTIWLFGTIHVLPAGHKWRTAPIDAAIAGSDALVLETVLDADAAQASAMLLRMGTRPGLPPLIDRIAPEKKEALAAMIARSKVPPAVLDNMETWTAALMLVGVTLADLKLEPGSGVEEELEKAFKDAGKPLSGLETPEEQLGFFDTLSEEAQRQFLGTLVDDAAKAQEEFARMLAAWSRGDEAAIAASFDDELEMTPALREALLVRRNANWAVWIRKRLEAPGAVMVAVGAGHLAGRESVQAMLAKEGVTVERVQ